MKRLGFWLALLVHGLLYARLPEARIGRDVELVLSFSQKRGKGR